MQVMARPAQRVDQSERLAEGPGAGERVVAVQVEVESRDAHAVRGILRGGPALPGSGRFAEAGGADGPARRGGQAQRDRMAGPRRRPGRGGELLGDGGGLVEVVQHQGGAGLERQAQQGARLDRGGDDDVPAGDAEVEHLGELAVAAHVEAEPRPERGLDQAEGLVGLACHEDPQVHAVGLGDVGQLLRVVRERAEVMHVQRAAVLLEQLRAGDRIGEQLLHPRREAR